MLAFILLTTCVGVVQSAASVQIGATTFNGLERTSPFDSNVYYGIKYAEAPRWDNPIPVDPTLLRSPYDASLNNKPMCMQNCVFFPEFACVPMVDEDCLYLNIYTPSSASNSSSLPVIFFIHGGNFNEGSGAAVLYESDRLVRQGVIVVTINYRLGIFGYLGSGNYGLRDQIEALKWVYNYISNFGGDPSKITAMGQSAGATSVNLLLVNRDSSRLIYRVILMSSPFTLRFRTPEQGEEMKSTFESKASCTVGDGTCANISQEAVLTYQDDPDIRNYDNKILSEFQRWGPVIDDDLVPNHPYNLYLNELVDLKDTLLGTTRDEGIGYVVTGSPTGSLALFLTLLSIDPVLIPIVALYESFDDTRFTLADIATDYVWRCVGREVGRLIVPNKKVYRYEFDDLFPAPILNDTCDDYACHGNDLPYVFGSLNYISEFRLPSIPFTPEDIALSDALVSAFTRFAKGRSPTRFPANIWRREKEYRSKTFVFTEERQFNSRGKYFNENGKCLVMQFATYNPHYTPTPTPSPTITSTLTSTSTLSMSTLSTSTLSMSTLPMSTLPMSTLPMSTLPMSTLSMSTLSMSTLPMSTLPMSTLSMSTLPMSTLSTSTLPMSTLPMSTLPMSTLPMSTLPMSTLSMSTLSTSTLSMSTLSTSTLSMSTLSMSTLSMSTLSTSTLSTSTLSTSTLSTMLTPTATATATATTMATATAISTASASL